jgi:uncharacterized lipoprotein YddW (UPF0748 family)
MKKLFRWLFLVFVSTNLMSCGPSTEKKEPEFWVWMHPDIKKTAADWNADFKELHDAGFTGVLIGSNIDVLKKAIPEAKKFDLEVHAWMWTMNRGDADSSWLSVNQLGKSLAEEKAYVEYYKFMCPALPEVKDFIKSKVDELAVIDGLEGIHMDYIRYVDAILPVGLQPKYGLIQDSVFPEFDYGYHPYMVNLYQEKTGINPFELDNPATDPDWLTFRLEELNKTVRELRDHIHDHGLEATAAVFPTPSMAREMVRQEWEKWELDQYFPMVYHNFYNEDVDWIKAVTLENRSVVPGDQKIITGLYLPALKDPEDFRLAIEAAKDGGADGVAFFEYRALTPEMIGMIRGFE